MMNAGAVIVLYNPDRTKLCRNINAVLPMVQSVVLVDNGSDDIQWIRELYAEDISADRLAIIENGANLGIAAALNTGMEYLSARADWVITLDQDSELYSDVISSNEPLIHAIDHHQDVTESGFQADLNQVGKIGIITPVIIDRNREDQLQMLEKRKEEPETQKMPRYVSLNRCITSGALTSVEAWRTVGKFDEEMFIDLVDFEFSCRLIDHGYSILRNEDTFILHEVGNISMRGWKKKHVVYNHNAMRKYYFARNYLYMSRKNESLHMRAAFYRIAEQMFNVIFYENNKSSKLKALTKGLIDGLTMPVKENKR